MKKLNFAFFCLSIAFSIPAFAVKAPEELYLDNIKDFALNHDRQPIKYFLLSNSSHSTTIRIQSDMARKLNNLRTYLEAEITCDGQITFEPRSLISRNKLGNVIRFKMEDFKYTQLHFPKEVTTCKLTFWDRQTHQVGGVNLYKDEKMFSFLQNFNNRKEACNYQVNNATPIQKLFLSNKWPMMTCAKEAKSIEILSDSEDALLTKIETLLGYKPDVSFIHGQNPYIKLDFSKAPKLDAIFLSTLLYRRDFSGTVLARLLQFHAKRGTLINIISTDYMNEKNDKELLKSLAMIGGNVRIQEYKFHDPYKGFKSPMRYLDNYLRDMHIKMFVTLSSSNLQNNVVIMGGRNVHDGFVYSSRPDFSQFPEMDQFPADEAYAYWNDLEIKVTSKELAESIYGHLLKLWNREIHNQKIEDVLSIGDGSLIAGEDILNSSNPMIRHFMSLPFIDDHALEKFYIEMIDKAEKSIQLSSPYLRPTNGIMKAIERAIKRNVDITIQTRIDLNGDTQAWLYEETNKAAINVLYDKIHLYEWTEDSILHTKLLIIDDSFAFFGSVNLSRRSFIHDVESGFLIHGQEFVGKFKDLFKSYNQQSKKITEKQKRKFWASLIVNIFENQF